MTRPWTRARLMLDRCDLAWGTGLGQCGGVLDATTHTWDVDYTCDVEPPAATPAWTLGVGVDHATASGGELTITPGGTDRNFYTHNLAAGALVTGQSLWGYARAKIVGTPANANAFSQLTLRVGSFAAALYFSSTAGSIYCVGSSSVTVATGLTLTDYHNYVMLVSYGGTAVSVWCDGTLMIQQAAASSAATPQVAFGKMSAGDEPTQSIVFDRVAYAVLDDVTLSSTPCYRTFCTCQNTTAYDPTATALALCTAHHQVPPYMQAIPCVDTIEHVPTRIDMKGGLGRRDQVTVSADDFQATGELIDPYYMRRPSWSRSSSFFARLKAVHKHTSNRTLYVDKGEIDDAGRIVEADLTTTRYVLERIERSGSGRWQVTAKDVLWRLENATVPAPSVGELSAAIATAGATTFNFVAGDGAAYGAAPFTVRIDDEIMTVGTRSTDACSNVTRGAWGTTAATHDAGAKVQLCTTWSSDTVDGVWGDVLAAAGIDAALIDTAGAAAEAGVWFATYALTACISEPTKASDLIADLVQQIGAFTWWDAEAQIVKFKGIHPIEAGTSPTTYTDDADIVGKSITVKEADADRISRIDCYYGVRDWSASLTEPGNFLRRVLSVDASAESASEYDETRDTRKLFAYFMPSTLENQMISLGARVLKRYRDVPTTVAFDLPVGATAPAAAQVVGINVRELVDADGANATTYGHVIAVSEDSDNGHHHVEVLTSVGAANGAYWTDDAHPDWDDATELERLYGFWCDDDGNVSGTTKGPTII